MSTTRDLVAALKAELKSAGFTYADLARGLGMAESSIKRIFARGDMPLSRIDEILRVLKLDFGELARRVADAQPLLAELSPETEKALVADRKLLLAAICVLSQWTFDQIAAEYDISQTELVRAMVKLDRLGVIELRPLNRYRLKLARTFRWRSHGPVMRYFREEAVPDYFAGGFDGEAETLLLVHGSVAAGVAQSFTDRLQRLGQDFAQQHLADQKLRPDQREGFTLLLAMRSWDFAAFADLKRPAGALGQAAPHAPRAAPRKGGRTPALD